MSKVTIIDNISIPYKKTEKNEIKIYWGQNDPNDQTNCTSINKIIEKDSDKIKNIYLNWINKIGDLKINNISLYEKLKIRGKYSAWWQSYFIQKSNYEHSHHINDAIKLIAFQEWAKKKSLKQINLYTSNKKLYLCLKEFSINADLIFKGYLIKRNFKNISIRSLINYIFPKRLKAIIWLIRRIKYSIRFINIGKNNFKKAKSDILFVDYLLNIDKDEMKKGNFRSSYWGDLTKTLKKNKIKSSWIHLPVNLGKNEIFFNKAKDISTGLNLINKVSNNQESHITIDSFISLNVVLKTIFDWLELIKKGSSFKLSLIIPKIGFLNLWDLYQDEWNESIKGISAISNCLDFNLFDTIFRNYNNDSKIVYLFENQTWEFSMIQGWRINKNQEIIGYAHSSISYWDLRKYFACETFLNPDFPMPDKFGLNGDLAKTNFSSNNIDENQIIKLEATRYMYLSQLRNSKNKYNSKKELDTNPKKILLVVFDYDISQTKRQLDILEMIYKYLNKNFKIIIKPHPGKPKINISNSKIKYKITHKPISELINKVDLVFTSNSTSVALEFFYLEKYIISMLDESKLNLSPLRKEKGVEFISNSKDLKNSLTRYKSNFNSIRKNYNCFYINENFCNWLALIQNNE